MALYLKYRPQDFSSLVGQEFIKETLKAAINQDKTVGAYMFTWPRWTGKTSTARIFAKAINCEDSKNWDPCGTCWVCKAFHENSLIDIIEIDAASYTWVDNIREIIEKAQFSPTRTKYKIYIIDEVHMLSKWAFNALLKILEEPPEHIKFILATTEIHKVPDTILSRCQRYDFKNFSDSDIRGRLQYIAKSEGIAVDDESYSYITKNAEGWMRNAVSLFEQLISWSEISYEHIVKTLGVASSDEMKSFINQLHSQDIKILEALETLQSEGKNLKNFFKAILWEISKAAIEKINRGEAISSDITLMEILSDMLQKSKHSFDEYMTFKIGVLKIISWYIAPSSNIKTVSQKTSSNQESPKTWPEISEKKSEVPEKKEEVSQDIGLEADDVAWIFWSETNPLKTEKNTGSFDIDGFIQQAKAKWAKAAVVMSLKWSQFNIDWDELQISSKTKISYNTLSKPEVKEIFLSISEEQSLGFTKVSVS